MLNGSEGELSGEAFVGQQSSSEDELAQGRVDPNGVNAGTCRGQQVLPRSAAQIQQGAFAELIDDAGGADGLGLKMLLVAIVQRV